jgi:hypothetical protein
MGSQPMAFRGFSVKSKMLSGVERGIALIVVGEHALVRRHQPIGQVGRMGSAQSFSDDAYQYAGSMSGRRSCMKPCSAMADPTHTVTYITSSSWRV